MTNGWLSSGRVNRAQQELFFVRLFTDPLRLPRNKGRNDLKRKVPAEMHPSCFIHVNLSCVSDAACSTWGCESYCIFIALWETAPAFLANIYFGTLNEETWCKFRWGKTSCLCACYLWEECVDGKTPDVPRWLHSLVFTSKINPVWSLRNVLLQTALTQNQ